LAAFHKLKTSYIDIQSVLGNQHLGSDYRYYRQEEEDRLDYLLIHFKFIANDKETIEEEAYYTISCSKGEEQVKNMYTFTTSSREFNKECSENEDLETKLVMFKCSKEIEKSVFTSGSSDCINELRYGQQVQKMIVVLLLMKISAGSFSIKKSDSKSAF
jgi:hypothetical protein